MKYQKSDWYRGLLEAERMIQEGWEFDYHEGLRIQFKLPSCKGTCAFYSEKGNTQFQQGCLDYVRHMERVANEFKHES